MKAFVCHHVPHRPDAGGRIVDAVNCWLDRQDPEPGNVVRLRVFKLVILPGSTLPPQPVEVGELARISAMAGRWIRPLRSIAGGFCRNVWKVGADWLQANGLECQLVELEMQEMLGMHYE